MDVRKGVLNCGLLVVGVLCLLAALFEISRRPQLLFSEAYRSLETGMPLAELENRIKEEWIGGCTFRGFRINYYNSPSVPFLTSPSDSIPSALRDPTKLPQITDRTEIPFVYDALQVLVSKDNAVLAYSLNGEELHVHTVTGDYPGSDFSKLPEAFFDGIQISNDFVQEN